MSNKVTVVMYHYVRELKYSRFPEIKGLDASLFKEQVAFLMKHYNFITVEQLIDSNNNNTALPPKSCLLTFDDGYIDHFTNVFPILNKYKIQGAFFPPIEAVTSHKVLDVNKIHFILAAVADKKQIITTLFKYLNTFRKDYELLPDDEYLKRLAIPTRMDTAEVMFIKRMLQYELDEQLRNKITDLLFTEILKTDEESFSKELYMNEDQLKCMLMNGMHIGSHGLTHCWLGKTEAPKQKAEIEASVDFLKKIGVDQNYLSICYPFGSYNSDTLSLLSQYNFKAGFTTEVNIAQPTNSNRFTLPRLDTNDLPKDASAVANDWFAKG
ncbi:MAG TPA: polysaccharide deacetylase family protein [Mucilaginibacter sp.]